MERSSRAAALLALFLAGCPAPDEAACSTDADCGSGKRCSSGSCVGSEPTGGGSGGEGPVLDGCGASDDCKSEQFRLVPTVYWDGGDGDPVCTVPPGGCPQGGTCRIPAASSDPLDAPREGLFRCALDEECTTGRCLDVGGVGLCLRACASDDDCPLTVRVASPPAGFRCGEVVHRGVPVRSCLPVDEAHPERTLCARAEDCAAPGAPVNPAVACRFVGHQTPWLDAVPVCDVAVPEPHPTGTACPASGSDPVFTAACDGGACVQLCGGGTAEVALCEPPEYFCTRPCNRDADCPSRTICRNGSWGERVGNWKIPDMQNQDEEDGRDVRFCQLPDQGCLDEIDCCPVPDGLGGCFGGWSGARDRCTVLPAPGTSDDRLITVCNQPVPGAAAPGSCCAVHDECDSLLCVPARDGTPCAGSGVCSVPCSPFPDPDGVPGSGDERERCALGDFAGSTYHQASTCQPFEYSRSYTDPRGAERTAAATLQVCR